MKKYRIVERSFKNGEKKYVIQKKHFLFRYWEDLWLSDGDASVVDQFSTLDEAKKMLNTYTNKKIKDGVVYVKTCYENKGDIISVCSYTYKNNKKMPTFKDPPSPPPLKHQIPPDEDD